jgi:23S rRNA (pseudouridine1915-N3)-methyltransferase
MTDKKLGTSGHEAGREFAMITIWLVFMCLSIGGDAWIASTFWGDRVASQAAFALSSRWTMGMTVKIRIVGRRNGCEQWLEDAYSMYETRLRSSNLDVETLWHKNDADLIKGVEADRDKGHTIVLMDPTGTLRSSENFSEELFLWLEEGGSRVVFVIGGAPGLPPELKYHALKPKLISLSTMTFTHQFARTILMEQIYRAAEIRKGSGYHK